MCTAYELGKRGGSFPEWVNADAIEVLLGLGESPRLIRPTLSAPVILPDGSATTMGWGFRRTFAPKIKGKAPVMRTIVNSREDKLEGRTWRKAFRESRCLIPASSFYEWIEVGGKMTPLRFERPSGEWLWIAGIWETNEDHGDCYSMITTEPTAAIAPIHDRMPAVLGDSQIAAFLNGQLNEFGPSSVALAFQEAENFLKPKASGGTPPDQAQGELF